MSEWRRKKDQSWPSRRPVWAWGAFFVALLVLAGALARQYKRERAFLQRYLLPVYVKTWMRGSLLPANKARYQLIDAMDAKGKERTAVGGEVEQVTRADGTVAYAPTVEARQDGAVKLKWNGGVLNDRALHAYLGHWIYRDRTVWEMVKTPVYWALGTFPLGLFVAVPKDRKRAPVIKSISAPLLLGKICLHFPLL